jgi:hypothetical protein
MCSAMPRAESQATTLQVQKIQKNQKFQDSCHFLACTTSRRPLGSEKSHFFTWLCTKLAVLTWMVGRWEYGYELEGSPFVLKNVWIRFRTWFSWVGNNPSLQIHLFCANRGKYHRIWDSTYGLFSAVLMRNDVHVADCSYLPWNEAYKHSLPLPSHLLSMLAGKASPMGNSFSPKFSLNKDYVRKCCVYIVSCCLHEDCSSWHSTYPHLILTFMHR